MENRMVPVHPPGRGTYLVAILADYIGTVPQGKRPRFGRLDYRKRGWHEKSNVGVDDVFEVNSSTLGVFGVGVGP